MEPCTFFADSLGRPASPIEGWPTAPDIAFGEVKGGRVRPRRPREKKLVFGLSKIFGIDTAKKARGSQSSNQIRPARHSPEAKPMAGGDLERIGIDARFFGSRQKGLGRYVQKLVEGLEKNTRYQIPDTRLVGFENHSGKTYLESETQPLGSVLKGSGNNGKDGTEGAVYKNAFGCYLHGSLLPKNPHFADYLIAKALERRYGIVNLKPLNDFLEWQAHQSAIKQTNHQS